MINNISNYDFDFDIEKNELLIEKRGISFNQIIETIHENGFLLNIDHPNKNKHPNQKMFIIQYSNYVYCVPYVIDHEKKKLFLKAIYPSRKFKKFLIQENENEKKI